MQYRVIRELGRGSFGTVSQVEKDGQIQAMKEIKYDRMSSKEKELLVAEVNILRDLSHPNIVRYIDREIDRTNSKLRVFMEYCAGGDLAEYIRRHKTKQRQGIREEVIWSVFAQMVAALHQCHNNASQTILHRDIKPGNIMIDKGQWVKLGDFGLARELKAGSYAFTNVGTPLYMSPEQIKKRAYNERSDIWSLGCVIYELAALQPPFTAKSQEELNRHILYSAAEPIKHIPYDPHRAVYTDDLWSLVKRMLAKDPINRPRVADLMRHEKIITCLRSMGRGVPQKVPAAVPAPAQAVAANTELAVPAPIAVNPKPTSAALDARERELDRREADLKAREAEVTRREADLTRREKLARDERITGGAAAARPYAAAGAGYRGIGHRLISENYRNV